MQYIFIFNGLPGREGIIDSISRQIEREGIECTKYVTTDPGDAARYANVFCEANPSTEVCFAVCGGHGLLNEVASAIVGRRDKYLAFISQESLPSSLRKCLQFDARSADIMKINDSYALSFVRVWTESAFFGIHDISLFADGSQKKYRFLKNLTVRLRGGMLSVEGDAFLSHISLSTRNLRITSPDLLFLSLDGEIIAAEGACISIEKDALYIVNAK